MNRSVPFDLKANRLTLLRLAIFSAAIGFAAYLPPATASPVLFDTFGRPRPNSGPNDSYNIDFRYGAFGPPCTRAKCTARKPQKFKRRSAEKRV